MNILVCVKQVPDNSDIQIDPITNNLVRTDDPGSINPFDAYAVEVAARIKDKLGGSVSVMSMGPEPAKVTLRECLAVGADKAYHISDRVFAGADTLATAYTLACAIRQVEQQEGPFDLILCGRQSIDGDTAQVGPKLAEELDIAQATCVVEVDVQEQVVQAKQETESGFALLEIQLPCLLTLSRPNFEPRLPSIKSKLAAKKAPLTLITSQDMPVDLERCGLKGSPTKVKHIFIPESGRSCQFILTADETAAAQELAQRLAKQELI